METITFAKLVENALTGTELVRTNYAGNEEIGIWLGRVYSHGSVESSYVYNVNQKAIQSIRMDSTTEWRVRMDTTGTPSMTTGVALLLVESLAAERIDYLNCNRRLQNLDAEFDTFKRVASETFADWANENLSDERIVEFSEVMETAGLQGIKRQYTVHLSVTYAVQVSVEATSADAASEEVDNNLSDYIYDNIDTSYWEDYSIDNVEEE